MLNDAIIYAILINAASGALGAIAAIATKPPISIKEGIWRLICGIILSIFLTDYSGQWLGIDQSSFSKNLAISAALGFCGWHALTMLMVLLDAGVARVNDKKLSVIPDIIDFIRGKKGE